MSEYKKHRTFVKGEKARVLRKAESGENGWRSGWIHNMDKYAENNSVLEVVDDWNDLGVKCSVDNGKDFFTFPHFVLELVAEEKEKNIEEDCKDMYRKLVLNKAKWMTEIKSLEQEYKRNLLSIKELQNRNCDVSFEIQKRLDKIEEECENYDSFKYENNLGEFSL